MPQEEGEGGRRRQPYEQQDRDLLLDIGVARPMDAVEVREDLVLEEELKEARLVLVAPDHELRDGAKSLHESVAVGCCHLLRIPRQARVRLSKDSDSKGRIVGMPLGAVSSRMCRNALCCCFGSAASAAAAAAAALEQGKGKARTLCCTRTDWRCLSSSRGGEAVAGHAALVFAPSASVAGDATPHDPILLLLLPLLLLLLLPLSGPGSPDRTAQITQVRVTADGATVKLCDLVRTPRAQASKRPGVCTSCNCTN